MTVRLGRLALAVLCAVWLTAAGAWAYDEAVVAEAERAVSDLSLQLKSIEASISSAGIGDEQLSQFRTQVEDIRTKAAAKLDTLVGPIGEVNQQITQLGPAPAEGATEAEQVAAQRKLLNDELNRLLGPKSQLDLISVGAEQLSGRISAIQRDQFVKRIFESSRSILNPYLWADTWTGVGLLYQRIANLLRSWWSDAGANATPWGLALIPGYLLVFLGVFVILRRVVGRWTRSHGGGGRTPNDAGRLWRVVRGLFASIAISFVLLGPIFLSFENLGWMTPRFGLVFNALVDILALTFIYYTLARRLAAPGEPQWRLINVSDGAAKQLSILAGIAAFVSVGNEQLIKVADGLFLPVIYTVGHSALAALLVLALLAAIILILRNQPGVQADLAGRRFYFGWARKFVGLLWLSITMGLVALLFGYLSFANYLAQNLLNTGLLLIALFLVHHLSDAAVAESFYPQSSFGRLLRTVTGLGERAIERLGLLFRTVVDIVLLLIGLPSLFALWTVTWVDFRSMANTALAGLKVGEFTLSPWSVIVSLMILAFGIVITNVLIRWFDRRILSETRIDKGVQDSLRKGASYAGYALAALTALTAGGLDFSSLALIAGALGVGIGLGLQSITNNFVSGLILLVERPIRVGDWVAIDAGEGLVKRINVRSTEIESFDNCSIIVPNSSLVTGVVRNWTHGDTMGRFLVAVTVDYQNEADKVRDLLLELARAHPKVLTFPEPQVMLARFGPLGLDFELRAHVADIFDGYPVASDLRYAVLARFREKGITIPKQVTVLQVARN